MSDDLLTSTISVDDVHNALNLVVFTDPKRVERPEPMCAWPKLCGSRCQFPRYMRRSEPNGLVPEILIQLDYPMDLLKALDIEYETGEIIHPGVKIQRSRNKMLRKLDPRALALLAFLQRSQKVGLSWSALSVEAFRPRTMVPFLDVRKRPWLY